MKAIVKTKAGSGYVELLEKAEPVAAPGNVKIKVEAAGICGTDLKIRAGDSWCNPPVILCHEFSGTVTDLGEGVTSVQPGDRVVAETAQVVCGKCEFCMTGNFLMCPSRLSIGYGVDGAFASTICVREGILHKIPEGVSFDEAALCEPLAVAVHAVYDAVALRPTDTVVVMGPGTIGQLTAQVASSFGCRVFITGTPADSGRLATARTLGAEPVLPDAGADVPAQIRALTGGRGADYVFDCSGAAPAVRDGLLMLKRRGTLVQIGLTKPAFEIPYQMLPQNELTIKGTFGHNWLCWENALQLLTRKKVDVKPLISAAFPLDQWEEAFAMAQQQKGIKILIHPNA